MVVAIDGPAGAGKSTVAALVAEKTDLFYLNSGNFYRAVTLKVLENNADPENDLEVIKSAESTAIEIREGRTFADGIDVEDKLHTPEVDRWVSEHSAIIPVRHVVVQRLRDVAQSLDIIMEGRDITTVVFPNAEVKIYLDADVETRVKRRFSQGIGATSLDEIRKNIIKRDKIDKNKAEGSLRIAPDAVYLDTSDLTIDQVCEKVVYIIHSWKNQQE
ncbi:MAG: (d)CMP kinase [Spirochaetia bacterium]